MPYSTPLTLTRSDSTYGLPLKHRIEVTSLDGTDVYFVFSPLEGLTTDINNVYLDCERASFETGSFNCVVEDSQNIINKDHLRNAKLKLSFGKTTATLIPYFIGYADIFQTRRPRNNYQEYLLTGPSTKIQATELMLLIRKAADDPNNPLYGIANLIIQAITTRKWRPLNREDIQEVTEDQGGRWLARLEAKQRWGGSDEIDRRLRRQERRRQSLQAVRNLEHGLALRGRTADGVTLSASRRAGGRRARWPPPSSCSAPAVPC